MRLSVLFTLTALFVYAFCTSNALFGFGKKKKEKKEKAQNNVKAGIDMLSHTMKVNDFTRVFEERTAICGEYIQSN